MEWLRVRVPSRTTYQPSEAIPSQQQRVGLRKHSSRMTDGVAHMGVDIQALMAWFGVGWLHWLVATVIEAEL